MKAEDLSLKVEHTNDPPPPSLDPKEEEDDEFVDPPSPPYIPDLSDIQMVAFSPGYGAPKVIIY